MLESEESLNDVLSLFSSDLASDFARLVDTVKRLKASLEPMTLMYCLDLCDASTVTRESLGEMALLAREFRRCEQHCDFLMVILSCKRRITGIGQIQCLSKYDKMLVDSPGWKQYDTVAQSLDAALQQYRESSQDTSRKCIVA